MFVDSELGECQVALLESQDVGVAIMILQEMQNEVYDIRNDVQSEQEIYNVDHDILREGAYPGT